MADALTDDDCAKMRSVLRKIVEEKGLDKVPFFTAQAPQKTFDWLDADGLFKLIEGPEPDIKFVMSKNRQTGHSTFPSTFPGQAEYTKGFSAGMSEDWLLKNSPDHSRITFRTHSCAELVDHCAVHGPITPGTLVVQHPTRRDLDKVHARTGIIVSVTETMPGEPHDVNVAWNPWKFKRLT